MATVRFSQELRDRIVKVAKNKMQPAIDRVMLGAPDQSWGQKIYDTMFMEELPLIRQLPSNWFRQSDNFYVEAIGDVQCQVQFKFPNSVAFPNSLTEGRLYKRTNTYNSASVNLKDDPAFEDFKAVVVDYNNRLNAAVRKRDEFVAGVKKVVNAYTTLAPALKAWPALWELIPDDVKEKHREVKERSKGGIDLDVDLNKLTAVSTAAKFGV